MWAAWINARAGQCIHMAYLFVLLFYTMASWLFHSCWTGNTLIVAEIPRIKFRLLNVLHYSLIDYITNNIGRKKWCHAHYWVSQYINSSLGIANSIKFKPRGNDGSQEADIRKAYITIIQESWGLKGQKNGETGSKIEVEEAHSAKKRSKHKRAEQMCNVESEKANPGAPHKKQFRLIII